MKLKALYENWAARQLAYERGEEYVEPKHKGKKEYTETAIRAMVDPYVRQLKENPKDIKRIVFELSTQSPTLARYFLSAALRHKLVDFKTSVNLLNSFSTSEVHTDEWDPGKLNKRRWIKLLRQKEAEAGPNASSADTW